MCWFNRWEIQFFAFSCWVSNFNNFLLSTTENKFSWNRFCFSWVQDFPAPFFSFNHNRWVKDFQQPFAFHHWKTKFLKFFLGFNRWVSDLKYFFCFQPLVKIFLATFFLSTARFKIFNNFLLKTILLSTAGFKNFNNVLLSTLKNKKFFKKRFWFQPMGFRF